MGVEGSLLLRVLLGVLVGKLLQEDAVLVLLRQLPIGIGGEGLRQGGDDDVILRHGEEGILHGQGGGGQGQGQSPGGEQG